MHLRSWSRNTLVFCGWENCVHITCVKFDELQLHPGLTTTRTQKGCAVTGERAAALGTVFTLEVIESRLVCTGSKIKPDSGECAAQLILVHHSHMQLQLLQVLACFRICTILRSLGDNMRNVFDEIPLTDGLTVEVESNNVLEIEHIEYH